jgi:formylglycine-generating enzyme required for sulfatase activity
LIRSQAKETMSEKFALIIANTEYTDPGLAQLTAPGKDAKEFARVLDSREICAFDDVIILFNENASKVSETIDYFLSNRKPSDLLVLYFSGHGVRDEYGSLYLAVTNTNRERLRSTAIKSDFIREAMDQSRSKRQVLILDCCNSGAFAQGTKAEIGGSVGTASAFEGTGYGRVVLTASDSTQFAWEGDRVIGATENSLFTHFLVKGMEGDADANGDGRITIDELYDYAYEQIVNITPKQTPGKWSYKQQGEIVLRQNIRVEDTKPVPLPDDLVGAMNNSLPYIREGAVTQLELLLKGKNLSLARSARLALERIAAEDDSRRVAQAATKALESSQEVQKESPKAGSDLSAASRTGQLRREKMEQEIHFKAEQTKLMQEKSDLEKRLQEEQTAREKIETQQKIKTVSQTTSVKSPLRVYGIALVAVLILGIAYAATRFRSPASIVVPTETLAATHVPTESISTSTELPNALPITGKDSPTPTEEPPTATSTPTEVVTMTPSGPTAEITSNGAAMVLVPAGNFTMGSTKGDLDEKPIHSVYLDAYYIDKFEVTNALYQACVNADGCKPPAHADSFTRSSYYGNPLYGNYPVVYVDWNMAKAYCEWRGARLPTEAEWEKAARGPEELIYPWGKGIDCQKANYTNGHNACAGGTSKVGTYEAGKSPYGAYDMAGNVWEWVADWYSATYYMSSLPSNPMGPDSGRARVARGGSWNRGEMDIRSSNRVNYAPTYNNFDLGFRCASDVPQ